MQGEPWTSLEGNLNYSGEQQGVFANTTEQTEGAPRRDYIGANRGSPRAMKARRFDGAPLTPCVRHWGTTHQCAASTVNIAPDSDWENKTAIEADRKRVEPTHDPHWMAGKCQECDTPNVIGCAHQSEGESDEDSWDITSENFSVIHEPQEPLAVIEHTKCWIRMALQLDQQLVVVPLPEGVHYCDLMDIVALACPIPDTWAMDIALDLYLPAVSGWFSIEDCMRKFPTLSLEQYLDLGMLRARTRWRVRGGAKKKSQKPKKPQRKNPVQRGPARRSTAQRVTAPVVVVANPSRPKNGGTRAIRSNEALRMAACTAKWLESCAKPFAARNPCIPANSIPSIKSTGFVRINVDTGTANFGYVGINPTYMNDLLCIVHTTTAFVGTGMAVLNNAGSALATGINTAGIGNLPYKVSDGFGSATTAPALQGRVVSCGMRTTYAGTLLNMSGVQTCYSSPAHGNAILETTLPGSFAWGAQGSSMMTAVVEGITQKPCNLECHPISDLEIAYPAEHESPFESDTVPNTTETFFPFTHTTGFSMPFSGTPVVGNFQLTIPSGGQQFINYYLPPPVMFASFKTSAAATFLVEIIVHVEYIGPKTATLATPNIADPQGLQAAQAVLQRIPLVKQRTPGMDAWAAMKTACMEVAAALKPIAIGALTKGLARLVM